MGWEKQPPPPPPLPPWSPKAIIPEKAMGMTPEQMEMLQKQIAAFITICEQLEDLHKSLCSSSQNHHTNADPSTDNMLRNLGIPYYTQMLSSSNHQNHPYNYGGQPKIPRRRRWNPTPGHLRILEQVFDQGNESPSKERIKSLTDELADHGEITESNVYNWFQNRRARFRRRQSMSTISESDGETSSKSVDGEIPNASDQLNGDPSYSKEDSLTAGSGDGGGAGGRGDESFGDMAGRTLSSKSKSGYMPEPVIESKSKTSKSME
ncbi:OLC1v1013452C1 [Oldenlandia corymbosa var. corymbosa]|uniref:OLC1v1013452C1 n=1 Tax=Oldenlandia corymbosa var. corymbosa TaxID=529605 RepID=A0AAV1DYJ2_OLDCO|nr:OLC1v1013452C1 [Oldenlandia corymbosa var. corymbosa]